jgi:hypothetical protein
MFPYEHAMEYPDVRQLMASESEEDGIIYHGTSQSGV